MHVLPEMYRKTPLSIHIARHRSPRDPLRSTGPHCAGPIRDASHPSRPFNKRTRRIAVKGELPSPLAPPPGCAFHPRCPFANERCRGEVPKLQFYPGTTHLHACHAVEERRLPDLP